MEHETQEAQQTQGSNLVNQVYIPDPFGSGYDRQDISGAAETFEGELAESWSLSDDGLTVTFNLRDGLFSQAGNPFTFEDVLYTWQRNFDIPGLNAFLSVLRQCDGGSGPEPLAGAGRSHHHGYHAVPNETFMHSISALNHSGVVDSVLLKSKATEEDPWALEYTANNTHGFGAFGVTKFEQGKEAIWEPNPGYYFFQKDGMPNYKRMIWRQIPESATRLSLVQRGDVHIAKQMLVREQEEAERGEGIQGPQHEDELRRLRAAERRGSCRSTTAGAARLPLPPSSTRRSSHVYKGRRSAPLRGLGAGAGLFPEPV